MKMNRMLILLGVLLSSCAETETENGAGNENVVPEPDVITTETSILASCSQTLESRTSLNSELKVIWNANDQIKLFGATMATGVVYATESDAVAVAAFDPTGDDVVTDEVRYAIYPASAAEGSELNGTTLAVDFSALAAQEIAPALDENSEISALPMIATSSDKNFDFKNLCGGIKLQLNDYQKAGIKIASISIKGNDKEALSGSAAVTAADGVVTLQKSESAAPIVATFDSAVALSESSDFVIFLPAATYASGLTVAITAEDGSVFSQETADDFAVEAGVVKPMQELPITLYYGTTNCYRVAAATTIEIDVTPYYSLAADYTPENNQRVDSEGNLVSKATTATVLWSQTNSDETGNVTSATPTIAGTTLSVPVSGVKGNALVAIQDEGGSTLWSYHIWVSEAADVSFSNDLAGNFKLMDRNLGATSISPKDQNAYGTFYQWGRKDPFPHPLGFARPGSPYKVDVSELIPSEVISAETGTVAYTIANPDKRLIQDESGVNDWHFGVRNNGLWGNRDSETKGVKSVYDPCPEGYCIPHKDYCAGFNFSKDDGDATECNNNYGRLFETSDGGTSYFPTAGYLDAASENMIFPEYRGYQWTTNGGDNGSFYFGFNNATAAPSGQYRANSISVRCIKIE